MLYLEKGYLRLLVRYDPSLPLFRLFPIIPRFHLHRLSAFELQLMRNQTGEHHKWQRKILNPFFSEKHMRDLLPIFWPVVNKVCILLYTIPLNSRLNMLTHAIHPLIVQVCSVWESKLTRGASTQTMNVYLWASRSGLEFIARGGLGTSLDQLEDGGTSTFTELVKEMVYVLCFLLSTLSSPIATRCLFEFARPTLSRLHVPMQLLPIMQPIFDMLPEWFGSALLRNAPFAPVCQRLRLLRVHVIVALTLLLSLLLFRSGN